MYSNLPPIATISQKDRFPSEKSRLLFWYGRSIVLRMAGVIYFFSIYGRQQSGRRKAGNGTFPG